MSLTKGSGHKTERRLLNQERMHHAFVKSLINQKLHSGFVDIDLKLIGDPLPVFGAKLQTQMG